MISRLGRFEIEVEIGRGGFGQVFRAHDPLMNRVVAVKMLTATEDAGSFNRFKNEATAAGNLHHENIVTVHEFGQEGQTPFLVMEYLNGEDLQNIISNQTPLSLYQKVRIMDRVADGLHCAHMNGVLHRDVKPANIMVLKAGGVKIMDFGIARLVRDSSTRLTQHGFLIGTVVYMAPELFSVNEVEVDALCDIWSYGVVLYELLSGKNPFRTGSLQSEMFRIINLDLPPLPPETCPPELQAVITRLLARRRGLRYQTFEETRFDLQPILNNLKKAEADRRVSLAQQMMFERQWTAALDAAREARKMDPQNGTARIIFDRVQDELRKQSMHPRIDDLLRRSNEAAERKNIPEAISLLEAALDFDSTHEKVLFRLHELRSLKAKLEEAVNLVSEAGEGFRAGRLTEAFERASEAVSLDPDNLEGRQLFESIQTALRDREEERALQAHILKARGLMAIDDVDGAMETLKAAESSHPGNSTVRSLLAQISSRIAERERRLEFTRRLDHAKVAVRSARFDEAVTELEQLLAASPQEGEVADLLAYARQEIKAKSRSAELKRIADAAVELNRKQAFNDALQILEDGLKTYPNDLSLTRLLRSTYAELQNSERERALRAGLQRCEALCRDAKWQEALNLVALLVSDNPNNRDLADLDAKIRHEKNQAERGAAIRSAVEKAERLLNDRQPDAAVKVLEAASRSAGGDVQLKELLKKAEDARQAESDRQYIESELRHARVFEERGEIPTSLRIIDGALRRSPKSPELLAARERLSPAVSPAEATALFPPPAAVAQGNALPAEPVAAQSEPEPTERLSPAASREESTTLFSPPAAVAQGNAQREEPVAAERAAARPSAVQPNVYVPSPEVGPKKKWQTYGIAGLVLVGLAGLVIWMHPAAVKVKVTPEKLNFAWQSGARPAAQTITVSGSSNVATPRTNADWIKVTPGRQGTGTAEFNVQVIPDKLPPGRYNGVLTVSPNTKVAVNLVIPPPGGPDIQPASLTFAYSPGGVVARQKIVVTGPGAIPDPKPSERWLTFTRHNLGKGKAEFLVQVSADGLPPGLHSALLTFAPAHTVPVALMIPGGSTSGVSPAFLSFTPDSPEQKVTYMGPGVIPDPTPSEPWVTFTRASDSPGKAEFMVKVSAADLEPGKYHADLSFADRKVQVELTVPEDTGPLEVKPDSLAFPDGGSQQTITVTGPIDIPNPTVTDRWVKVKRRDLGAGIAEFDVQASPAGLVAGPHVAYVNFSPLKKVRIVLTVTPNVPAVNRH